MAFVPEGQPDRSQALRAWNHEENGPVPAGRLNRSRLRLEQVIKTQEKHVFSIRNMDAAVIANHCSHRQSHSIKNWIHWIFRQLQNFSWQQVDGAFSVSVSPLPETIHYIQNQVGHHRTRTFQQEYLVQCIIYIQSTLAANPTTKKTSPHGKSAWELTDTVH